MRLIQKETTTVSFVGRKFNTIEVYSTSKMVERKSFANGKISD